MSFESASAGTEDSKFDNGTYLLVWSFKDVNFPDLCSSLEASVSMLHQSLLA